MKTITTRPARHGTKKRLYLSRPEPDLLTTRRQITRFIPRTPSPPPCPPPPPIEEPCPVVEEPSPPCPPPALPEPEPEPEPQIEVIAVDVEPSIKSSKSSKSSRSRSRGHSHSRREKEIYIERDRFIPVPVPVPVEPEHDTFRYVEAPRRYIEPPSPPPRRIEDRNGTTHVHIRTEDRERSGGYCRDYRERDIYDCYRR
ncbi:hypothetical protein C2857_002671 [Epichloe festucae Fl1]|uniref:Uncharacterized protein n=1 Tax=Epichloe festucae (strain Fl1) TaxID=877507 RepID=A0A7S9KS98_EPIFF|nr:hypothetical protein C2857_002671 [Epichloe festucae Fl1]